MDKSSNRHDIYLEIGERKVFAGAVEWPGWCRSGRDEESAILALLESGPRYLHILQATELDFIPPEKASAFNIVERLAGNRTTDFGAPDVPLMKDQETIDTDELERLQTLLRSCWIAFDEAVKLAEGKQLRKGPRGGGQDLEAIVDHVLIADVSYLKRIGWKIQLVEEETADERLARVRQGILDGLVAATHGELPSIGPRGGKRWSPRFFVRRVAWHVIDHAWEIDDRIP